MADSGIHKVKSGHDNAIISGIPLPRDAEGGIHLRELKPGTVLEVHTRNTVYTLARHESGSYLIAGHPEYCPTPTWVTGLGSAYSTGLVRDDYLVPGMRLSFLIEDRRVNTSSITAIEVKRRN